MRRQAIYLAAIIVALVAPGCRSTTSSKTPAAATTVATSTTNPNAAVAVSVHAVISQLGQDTSGPFATMDAALAQARQAQAAGMPAAAVGDVLGTLAAYRELAADYSAAASALGQVSFPAFAEADAGAVVTALQTAATDAQALADNPTLQNTSAFQTAVSAYPRALVALYAELGYPPASPSR
jgi:hypothetical protein